jgi:Mrp family chromosome partitioning ATPase
MSRTIQANLRYPNTDRPLKTIAISSAIANEGKSKVATNLAAAIAQVGQRVLLIEADLLYRSFLAFLRLCLQHVVLLPISGKR